MPRKDPHTGCMVMTTGEFWAAEAEREGKGRSGVELLTEMFEDMAAEEEKERAAWMDPKTCLERLIPEIQLWNEEDDGGRVPIPQKVVKVRSVELKDTFRTSSIKLLAEVIDEGGVTGLLSYSVWSSSGSWNEPPDGETEITWEVL